MLISGSKIFLGLVVFGVSTKTTRLESMHLAYMSMFFYHSSLITKQVDDLADRVNYREIR